MGILWRPVPCAVPSGPLVAFFSVESRDGDGERRLGVNVARGSVGHGWHFVMVTV